VFSSSLKSSYRALDAFGSSHQSVSCLQQPLALARSILFGLGFGQQQST
jgi:hypothetical protein